MIVCRLTSVLFVGLMAACATDVAMAGGPAVPRFDIKRSCGDADKVSSDFSKGSDYRGCFIDETQARAKLVKTWSSYSARQKRQCLEPGPDPSYVETLTCLQLNGNHIGGPVAPGVKF